MKNTSDHRPSANAWQVMLTLEAMNANVLDLVESTASAGARTLLETVPHGFLLGY